MNKISLSSFDIHFIDELSKRDITINKVHPLSKLIVTLAYIGVVISFDKYALTGLLPMILYPIILFSISEIPFLKICSKLIFIMPFLIGVGLFNPIFDRSFEVNLLGIVMSSGWISFISLSLRGALTVFASFLLIGTTSIEKICYALRLIKLPKIFVTQILLTYRYIFVLLDEASNMYNAYSLRAPREKGINYKVWGSLLGQLLLKSFDRANRMYNSMLLRGFKGEINFSSHEKIKVNDIIYIIAWIGIFILIRFVNIPVLLETLIR